MRTHLWVGLSRVLLCIVVGFIMISTWNAYTHDGFVVRTDLSDMVPSTAVTATQQAAVNAALNAAGQSVILVLESSDQQSLQQAVALVDEELAALSNYLHRQNSDDLADLITAKLAHYRFHLLTLEDRELLRSREFDFLLEQALGDLYSPSGELRLLPLNQDPFNFFSRYVESRADGLKPAPPAASVPAGETVNAFDPPFREIMTLRLGTAGSNHKEALQLNNSFKKLSAMLAISYPKVKVLRSGVLFFSQETATAARRDINIISVGSIAGVSVLMLLVFRSIRPLATAMVSILSGVGFAFTVVHLLFGSIHVFTILFGASLIGIVIDYSIHYFYHRMASDTNNKDNRRLYRALSISLVTSIAGFSALLFSSVVILQTIAVFSVCGILAAWLSVLALAPQNTADCMQVRQRLVNWIVRVMGNIGGYLIDRLDGRVALFALVMLLGSVALFSKGQDDPRRFVDLSEDLLQQSAEIRTIINDIEPGKFIIVEANNEQTLFVRLEELYSTVGNLARMVSVFNWLPSPSDQQLNYQVQEPLFQDSGLISELFLITAGANEWFSSLRTDYQQSANKPLTSERFFDLLDGQVSPMVQTVEDPEQQGKTLAAYVLLGSGSDLEGVRLRTLDLTGISYIDTVGESSRQLREQRISSLWLLTVAYAAILVLMWLLYRDSRALVMTAVPAISTVLTLAALMMMSQPLTLFHTMSLFLILGLGMDYVVFLNEMTDDQKTTRQAIALSGLTSMLSFGLLAFSTVPVARAFGLTILIGNSFNLLATLGLAKSTKWNREAPK